MRHRSAKRPAADSLRRPSHANCVVTHRPAGWAGCKIGACPAHHSPPRRSPPRQCWASTLHPAALPGPYLSAAQPGKDYHPTRGRADRRTIKNITSLATLQHRSGPTFVSLRRTSHRPRVESGHRPRLRRGRWKIAPGAFEPHRIHNPGSKASGARFSHRKVPG